MTTGAEFKSTGSLFTDAVHSLTQLLRGEVALAKAEVEENLRKAAYGLAFVVLAAIMAIAALNLLSGAIVAALVAQGMPPGWAALLVAAGFALLAILLGYRGFRALAPGNLIPRRAADQVKRDATYLKEIVTDDQTP